MAVATAMVYGVPHYLYHDMNMHELVWDLNRCLNLICMAAIVQ